MNRRKFLKLLGKVAAVSGIAAVVRLPEVSEINEEMSEVTFDYVGPTVARWEDTWSIIGPSGKKVEELYVDANGVLYAGGNYLAMPQKV